MAKEKDILVNQSNTGEVFVAEEVIRYLSKIVSSEVEGVGSLSSRLVDVFSTKDKQVSILSKDEALHIEVSISIYFGYNLLEVAQKVQFAVCESLKLNLNLEFISVDIIIKEVLANDSLHIEH